ncbi:MAG: AraC family transcriptional regulator ligand-binding domain-containing protein [Archangium sp.]|nr:AraC family transcriptional regulator ligand-binding domain-containing protein [Archangium sp.]MDP3154339.1 AraC family transcriptional regulator ligand-binding domain-containing protein [Archangium sp.]MDP3574156.1 AraC family transcriptional regulator ligand-binding domain-containing protein [Archangium sp.]
MARLGLDARAMREAVGPFEGATSDEAFEMLWNAARHRWPTDDLELAIAGTLQAGAFGPFDLSVLTSPSVGAACQVFAQTLPAIAGEGVVLGLVPRPRGGMTVRLLNSTPVNVEVADALLLATLIARLRQQTHPQLKPAGVWLTRAVPRARTTWDAFFGCTVRFKAPHSEIQFNATDWRAPLASSNAAVHRALVPLLPGIGGDVVGALRAHLRQHLNEPQSLRSVARRLGVSTRTLQRRLGEARVSLRELLAQLRVEEARRLLSGPQRTLGEVADQVGFASASSLARALRRAALSGR